MRSSTDNLIASAADEIRRAMRDAVDMGTLSYEQANEMVTEQNPRARKARLDVHLNNDENLYITCAYGNMMPVRRYEYPTDGPRAGTFGYVCIYKEN